MTSTSQELSKANDNSTNHGVTGYEASTSTKAGNAGAAPHQPLGQERLSPSTNAPAWENRISIAVDPVALITTECITVTSAMRKHARWAQSSVSAILGGGGALDSGRGSVSLPRHTKGSPSHQRGLSQSGKPNNGRLAGEDGLTGRWGLRGKKGKSMQDNPLMSAFARLRSDLRGCSSDDSPPLAMVSCDLTKH